MSDGCLKNIQCGFREMANGRGGRRPGAGRKAGGHNKRTLQFRAEVAKSGCTPLEHMLAVLHDERADADRRDRMAVAAAPFVHARLAVVDSTIRAEVRVSPLTEEQRRQRARAAILEAFREPQRVIEGSYQVIAGHDIAADVSAQAKGEMPVTVTKGEASEEP